jgi:pyruvate ferredoxin oxidoreductase gamma subunit
LSPIASGRDLAIGALVRLPARIRWHGRGGQGVVTASRLLAAATVRAGLYPLSLPEFGAERSGAPVEAHTRIDRTPPTLRSPIDAPDAVVVFDWTLLDVVDVIQGLPSAGVAVVNTTLAPEKVADRFGDPKLRIACIEGDDIARRLLGRPIPNSPLLGALLRAFPVIELAVMERALRAGLEAAFPARIVEANLEALGEGYRTVRTTEPL